jgi:hypothetical protein
METKTCAAGCGERIRRGGHSIHRDGVLIFFHQDCCPICPSMRADRVEIR